MGNKGLSIPECMIGHYVKMVVPAYPSVRCDMLTSHLLLLKYRYDPRYSFNQVTVWYVDRGALGDLSRAEGSMIIGLTDQYLEIAGGQGTKYIPYHRLRKILYDGIPVWER